MTWLALADHADQEFSLSGLEGDTLDAPIFGGDPNALLVRGSLMVEARLSPEGRRQNLLNFHGGNGWLDEFSLQVDQSGVTLSMSQNGAVLQSTVLHSDQICGELVRITYTWDAPGRWARLSVERPESGAANIATIKNPRPLLVSDLHSLFLSHAKRKMAKDVIYFALSDQTEPVGPTPKLAPQTPIMTANGYRLAGELKRGDLVRTETGDLVPILSVLRRTVPARGQFAPIQLLSPYYGLEQDITVAPDQRLVLRGLEVTKLFGRDAVLVPARHLVNGTAARHHSGLMTVSYTHLILPGHETVIAAGLTTESLYIGRLRRKTVLLGASLLADVD
ncbi:MAG: Hint domain-containing protein, partial [Roseibium sp.]